MNKHVLWVFGDSFSQGYNIPDKTKAWPVLLAQKLNADLKNFSQPAADNFFIYHCYLENFKNIQPQDIVIVGWSHYSRKSFVYNDNNEEQQKVLSNSILYSTQTKKLLRSISPPRPLSGYINIKPKDKNLPYYDRWFREYYSEYEQKCNFKSYCDSVKLTCPAPYLPFYFSVESLVDVELPNTKLYIVDFIKENKLFISDLDAHLNEQGHAQWAEILLSNLNVAN